MREGREGGCKHDKNECVIFFNKGRRKNEIQRKPDLNTEIGNDLKKRKCSYYNLKIVVDTGLKGTCKRRKAPSAVNCRGMKKPAVVNF